jgi:hypothetical protein
MRNALVVVRRVLKGHEEPLSCLEMMIMASIGWLRVGQDALQGKVADHGAVCTEARKGGN